MSNYTPSTRKTPGTIFLEKTLYKCNITSSMSYHFTGTLNYQNFCRSVSDVLSNIEKFTFKMNFKGNQSGTNNGSEYETSKGVWVFDKNLCDVPIPEIIECSNLELTYQKFCSDFYQYASKRNYYPFIFTILKSSINNEFWIVVSFNHAYLDGRGCETVLMKVIDYYNALTDQNMDSASKILRQVSSFITPSSDTIYSAGAKNSLVALSRWNNFKNLWRIIRTPLNDRNRFSVPYKTIDSNWKNFVCEPHKIYGTSLNIKNILEWYRHNTTDTNDNSILAALVVKAFYKLSDKENPKHKIISFRMMSDILTARQRQTFIGNYCAYYPISVDGSLTLGEIAQNINQQVNDFRSHKRDLTMYKFLEFAIRKNMAGKKDDPVSFTYSLIVHRKLNKHPAYMRDALFNGVSGGLNYLPLDQFGARLNNKIAPTFGLCPNDTVYLSYYQIPGNNTVLDKVTEAIKEVISNEENRISSLNYKK